MGADSVESKDVYDAIEMYFEKGWTDGLPVVPPRPEVVKQFIENIKLKALGHEVLTAFSPTEQVVKIVRDELIRMLGASDSKLRFANEPPSVFLIVGLQGSGKTTSTGKLSRWLAKNGHRPQLVSVDIYRPAAREQLRVVAEQAGQIWNTNLVSKKKRRYPEPKLINPFTTPIASKLSGRMSNKDTASRAPAANEIKRQRPRWLIFFALTATNAPAPAAATARPTRSAISCPGLNWEGSKFMIFSGS